MLRGTIYDTYKVEKNKTKQTEKNKGRLTKRFLRINMFRSFLRKYISLYWHFANCISFTYKYLIGEDRSRVSFEL